jgi:hypothetical protein
VNEQDPKLMTPNELDEQADGRRFDALLDTLVELDLIDKHSSASFCEQVREKLAARDAAQRKAGAVAELARIKDRITEQNFYGDMISVEQLDTRIAELESAEVNA